MSVWKNLTKEQAQSMVRGYRNFGYKNARAIKGKTMKNIFGEIVTEYQVQTGRFKK
jgi:hypothetical protein